MIVSFSMIIVSNGNRERKGKEEEGGGEGRK